MKIKIGPSWLQLEFETSSKDERSLTLDYRPASGMTDLDHGLVRAVAQLSIRVALLEKQGSLLPSAPEEIVARAEEVFSANLPGLSVRIRYE